eukprot:GILI01034614.1.p1 GENE.GILI01034614.1~~GILI01034614.1.p1  ORF type:complete len:251 (-),score=-0.08 GILI01034614.1:111-770(-)
MSYYVNICQGSHLRSFSPPKDEGNRITPVPISDADWFLNTLDTAFQKVSLFTTKFILIEADGRSRSSLNLDEWIFVFSTKDQTYSLLLPYSNGTFEEPRISFRPWLETVVEQLPEFLGLEHALNLVRQKGFVLCLDKQCRATYRKPLSQSEVETSYYLPVHPKGADRVVYARVGVFSREVEILNTPLFGKLRDSAHQDAWKAISELPTLPFSYIRKVAV